MNAHTRARVYEFICAYKIQHDGCHPTMREIQKATGISSTSVVTSYLSQIENAGLIQRRNGKIYVTGGKWIAPKVS